MSTSLGSLLRISTRLFRETKNVEKNKKTKKYNQINNVNRNRSFSEKLKPKVYIKKKKLKIIYIFDNEQYYYCLFRIRENENI